MSDLPNPCVEPDQDNRQNPRCEGHVDPISRENINVGNGVCFGRQCFDAGNDMLGEWLRRAHTHPVTRQPTSINAWLAAKRRRPPTPAPAATTSSFDPARLQLLAGDAAWEAGSLVEAEEHYRRALLLQQSSAPGAGEIIQTMMLLSSVLFARGQVLDAQELAERALVLAEAEEHDFFTGHAHRVLGEIHASTGRWQEGLSHLGRALHPLVRSGETHYAGVAHRLMLDIGEARRAIAEDDEAPLSGCLIL